MKTSLIAIATIMAITLSAANAFAQTNRSGLYLTAEDYINKKLSYSNKNSNGKYKIKVAPLFNKDRVQVIQNGEKHNFFQFDLFGYRDKNHDYRFFNDQQYKILDTSFFYVYRRVVSVNEGKAHYQKTNYYFSKKADGKIMDLTIENLKRTFSVNHKFQDLLDIYFKSDDELGLYDSFNKTYKVEHVFRNSFDKTAYSLNK